jgi:hypothetical protein
MRASDFENRILYHGTSTRARAKSIMREGIRAQSDESMKRSARGALTPVQGHIYLTPSIKYACIYGIGGNMVGSNIRSDFYKNEKYGFVFVVDGSSIKMQPDEDEVGYAVREAPDIMQQKTRFTRHMDNERFGQALIDRPEIAHELHTLAQRYLTPGQQQRIWHDYQYDILAQAGKKLLKVMPDRLKAAMVEMGCHVSTPDTVIPQQTWRFKKSDSPRLGFQAEHFFEVAERIA